MPSLLCVLLKCAVVALRGGQGLESLYKVVDQNSYKPVTALTLYNTQPPVRFSVLRNLEVSHLIIPVPMDLTVEFLDVTNRIALDKLPIVIIFISPQILLWF